MFMTPSQLKHALHVRYIKHSEVSKLSKVSRPWISQVLNEQVKVTDQAFNKILKPALRLINQYDRRFINSVNR